MTSSIIRFKSDGSTYGHLSIQGAIDSASVSETIVVYNGTYNENITLKDGVDLFFLPNTEVSGSLITGTFKDAGSQVDVLIEGRVKVYNDFGSAYNMVLTHPSSSIERYNVFTSDVEITGSLNVSGSLLLSGSIDIPEDKSIKFGGYDFITTDTSSQIAIGTASGDLNTGINQIAIGREAGIGNTGTDQVAIGFQAGQNNTGDDIFALGETAADSNTGDYIVAIGQYALFENTGTGSVAIGWDAGDTNTGEYQLAFGYEAGYENVGDYQIAIGWDAGYGNFGDYAITVGYNAGTDNEANDIVAFGYEAGYGNLIPNQFIVKQGNINATPLLQGDFLSGSISIGKITSPDFKGLDVSGSVKISGSLNVSESILSGGNIVATQNWVSQSVTSSWSQNSVSASYANVTTGSYSYPNLDNIPAGIVSGAIQISTGSFTGSFFGDGSNLNDVVTSSFALTSSYFATSSIEKSVAIAASDEITIWTASLSAASTFRMPYGMNLTTIKASLTLSGSTDTIIDINRSGSSILSTKLTIDSGSWTSKGSTTAYVIEPTSNSLAEDDEIVVDVDSVGSGSTGLKIYLIGN